MKRVSLKSKSFQISPQELDSARECARDQGVSLNKYLRLAVREKNQGVLQGAEANDTLREIRETVRVAEARRAMEQESQMADLRAEVFIALESSETLLMKALRAFSQFLTPEPQSGDSNGRAVPMQVPGARRADASAPESAADWQRFASRP